MTEVLDESATDAGSTCRTLRSPWSARRRIWSVVGVVAVAAGIASWVLLPGAVAIGRTGVLMDARPFTCARTADVTTWADTGFADEDDRVYVPALRMHPGLDCTMDLVVRNDSDVDVAVDSITVPMAGPDNGWGIHAYRLVQQGIGPTGGEHAIDAVFDYQHSEAAGGSYAIAPHSVQRFGVHLSWSDGCMDDHTAGIFTDAPTVVLAAGPWHLPKSWTGAGYAILGGKDTVAASCNP